MKDKITRRELNLLSSETIQRYLESKGVHSVVLKSLNEAVRKAVEDDKLRALMEAERPLKVVPVKRSWQDNIWIYITVGIFIVVIGAIIVSLILR